MTAVVLGYLLLNHNMETGEVPTVSVRAFSGTPQVGVGRPVSLGIELVNNSDNSAWLDGRLIFKYHILVQVADQRGNPVILPGLMTKIKVAPPKPDDFVKLASKVVIGRLDFTANALRFAKPGRYRVTVNLSHGASASYAPTGISLCTFSSTSTVFILVE